jgi:2'-hydroxyisoflavone reductase
MKILILGGTKFVGRHITQAALDGGHQVSLFNRGQTNHDLFPEVEKLIGDRDGNLDALKNRKWDVVIDVNGYVPRLVKDTANLLKDAVGMYIFISTISVYQQPFQTPITEDASLISLEDEIVEEITGDSYGGLKVLCEKVVEEYFPSNHVIVRPGIVIGPHDHTDRFSYWPIRVQQGGEILLPNAPDQLIQGIDGRDLANFTIHLADQSATGIFNAVGPLGKWTFASIIEISKQVAGTNPSLTWVDEKFLIDNEVQPWDGLPLWVNEIEDKKTFEVSEVKSIENGLVYRSIEDTIWDILAWNLSRDETYQLVTGISSEKERLVLKAWHAN